MLEDKQKYLVMKNLQHHRLNKSDSIFMLFHMLASSNVARKLSSNLLTVLSYHRIDDPLREGFDTFRPNISATPSDFAMQMDYVSQKYDVISGTELISYLKGNYRLPPHAAIITFDDGYYDNYKNAYPILKARNLPAIIFLATDFIGTCKPFFVDLIAYCFFYTKKEQVDLPFLGLQSWVDESTRNNVMYNWIGTLKKIPEHEKKRVVSQLPSILAVDIPDDAFKNLIMSWSDARELNENGIEIAGHTATHPILTRISLDEASSELLISKQRIEEEIGKPVLSFAYPNGQSADFNVELMERVHRVGFEIAFTLLPGPTRYATITKNPFAIRRIFLSYKDTFPRFAAKLAGINRITRKSIVEGR